MGETRNVFKKSMSYRPCTFENTKPGDLIKGYDMIGIVISTTVISTTDRVRQLCQEGGARPPINRATLVLLVLRDTDSELYFCFSPGERTEGWSLAQFEHLDSFLT